MMQSDDELTPGQRETLARLSREAEPPASLEEATMAALVARGLLRAPRRRLGGTLALAASVLLVAGGLALAPFGPPDTAADPRPRFVLLLYEGPDYRQPSPGRMDERVREYVAWAAAERADGAVEGGEKLRDGDDVSIRPDGSAGVVPPRPGEGRLAGYFLIRAADRQSALEIARSCPHVRYGGSIVLREIEPT
jgi:hypothetical protein